MSRKHSRTHLSPTEACAHLQRGHVPRAECAKVSPGPWMLFPAFLVLFHFSIISLLSNWTELKQPTLSLSSCCCTPQKSHSECGQDSHRYRTGQLERRESIREPKQMHFVRKAGMLLVLCEKQVHLEERRKLNPCQRNNLVNFLMNISATQSLFVDFN